jgi:O-antigen/teichoic acid export membrane protein
VIQRARDSFAEAAWVVTGSLGLVVITAATTKIFTTALGPAEYGRFIVYMTSALAVGQIVFAPVAATVARFSLSYERDGRLPEFVSTLKEVVLKIGAGMILLSAVAAAALAVAVGPASALLVVAVFAVGWFQGGSALFVAFHSAIRARRTAAAQQLLAGAARFGTAGLAVLVAGSFAWSIAVGYAVGAAVVFVLQARWLDPAGRLMSVTRSPDVIDHLKHYGRPFLGWGVTAVAVAYSDVWSVRLFGGDTAAGVYAVASLLASAMAVVQAMLVQYLFPVAFEQAGLGNNRKQLREAFQTSRRGALAMAALTLITALGAAVFGESIVLAISSPEFGKAAEYLPVLILGVGLLQTAEVLALAALSATRLRGLLFVKIFLAVVCVIANLVGAAILGAPGVAFAMVLTGSAYLTLVLALSVRLGGATR